MCRGCCMEFSFSVAWFFLVAAIAAANNITTSTNSTDTYFISKGPYIAKPGCSPKCGNVMIPYPFGIGEECAIGGGFDINCNSTFDPPKPFVGDFELYNISDARVRFRNVISENCYNTGGQESSTIWYIDLKQSPFSYSDANDLFLVSCDDTGYIGPDDGSTYTGCVSVCSKVGDVIDGSCSGIGCCQVSIPKGHRSFRITLESKNNHKKVLSFNPCSYAFLGEANSFKFRGAKDLKDSEFKDRILDTVPILLDWAIGKSNCAEAEKSDDYACKGNSKCVDPNTELGGYRCNCSDGYEGNPYLDHGCQDIDECADSTKNNCEMTCTNYPGGFSCSCPDGYDGDGIKENGRSHCIIHMKKKFPKEKIFISLGFGILSLLLIVLSWLHYGNKKRRLIKMREKFFHQNGGYLLRQQSNSNEGGRVESTNVFTAEELEKATNNYADDMILGKGGYGTVYKGILPDERVVAIKKSIIMDKSQVEQFINEVVILTQINHRNVVKLLGCCLEAEVPLLVYEYVSNGTLFDHIYNKKSSFLSWETRLRIASEAAGAISYLHSAASTPIIHRDVKSLNILLDDNYTTKVSDFGGSRLVPVDQTQVTTLVQGTLGYLDPGYFNTSQLTEKSDVYSFGVVLAELLTGKKPLCMQRSKEEINLAAYLVKSMKEDRLFQIIDPQILREELQEQFQKVAELIKSCLHLIGEDRPTMKEVAMELEGLRKINMNRQGQRQIGEEIVDFIDENQAITGFYYGAEARDHHSIQLTPYTNTFSEQNSVENDSIPMMFSTNNAR